MGGRTYPGSGRCWRLPPPAFQLICVAYRYFQTVGLEDSSEVVCDMGSCVQPGSQTPFPDASGVVASPRYDLIFSVVLPPARHKGKQAASLPFSTSVVRILEAA